jgi:hypothetical protein
LFGSSKSGLHQLKDVVNVAFRQKFDNFLAGSRKMTGVGSAQHNTRKAILDVGIGMGQSNEAAMKRGLRMLKVWNLTPA